MTDTINIHILNVKKYKVLYEQYQDFSEKKTSHVEGYMAVTEDGEVLEKKRLWKRSVFYADSGKFLYYNFSFDISSPSSNYNIRCRIRNMESDKAFMEIEFSMPKYFYGTNIFQLLGQPSHSCEAQYFTLIKGIRRFISEQFNQVPADKDIRIFRIDMCYNQFFNSRVDALEYLKAQKVHAQQWADGKNINFATTPSQTSWTMLTARYSFKCYHKGTEFEKSDYKELDSLSTDKLGIFKARQARKKHKYDKKKISANYDLKKLQEIADRILRYEITYRTSMISYMTMYYTFDKIENDKPYLYDTNLYRYLNRVKGRVDKIGGFGKSEYYIAKNGAQEVFEKFKAKRHKFCLRSKFDSEYCGVDMLLEDCITFNLSVYRLLYDFFWNRVKAVQINSRSSVVEMVQKITAYQERCKRRKQVGLLNKKKVKTGNLNEAGGKNTARLLIPALLSQFMDIRQCKQYLPHATYERLMSDISKAGIDTRAYNVNIASPKLDYQDNAIFCTPLIKNFQFY